MLRQAEGPRVIKTMLCTFCGTDNRQDNKFCGMCGVRLERRKVERRAYRSSSTLNCQACGHANEPGHRFCGMCGTVVERRSKERRGNDGEQPPVSALVNAQLPAPEIPVATAPEPESSAIATEPVVEVPPARTVTAAHRNAPAARTAPARPRGIGGPSFLGLNDDPPGQSADYLLEEEDGSSGGVIRKLVLVTLLAVIAGSAFVYWRSSLRALLKPHESVKTQPAAAPAPSPESGASDAASLPSAQPARASASDAAGAPDSTPAAPAASAAADKQPAPASPDAAKSTASATETTEPAASAKEKTATTRPKKSAEDTQPKPSAELVKAQQLLQGKGGVSQNCEQGLVYLRAAAQKNEPAAAVQMSTLYATGHCVQQDRVMAYRWLNSAHELAPSNPSIQTSMDVLWGQMTSQERRQAGR
jgi:hypothetical protein